MTREELVDAGLSRKQIEHRIHIGLLIREYLGVYRVGHAAPGILSSYMAAVKACGEGAVLSGPAAGWLHGLLKGEPPPPEVTTPRDVRVGGLPSKHSRFIEATTARGIPVTPVPATLVDLASVLPPDALARACHEAGVKYRTTPRQVERALAKRPRAKGAGNLRRVIHGDVHVSLSRLEKVAVELMRHEGLPLARARTDRGARQLPLPQFPPLLGAGPPAGARGAREGRRVPPLHIRGRVRGPELHAAGADEPAS